MSLLPPSIPNGDLIAKTSPRGPDGGVIWTGYFADGFSIAVGRYPADAIRRPSDSRKAMTYVMHHWTYTKRNHRVIDEIQVTNQFCGVGNGWDIVVYGDIVQHEAHKTTAQAEAEKLLDGKM